MQSKDKILKDYIKYRSLTNKSRAINDIKFHVEQFINSNKKPLVDFQEKDLINYITKISPKYTQSSLNSIKSSYLKNFVKWFFEDWSSRFRNLDKILSTNKAVTKYKSEDMISEEDFKKLIQGEESFFWKGFFMTLFYGGCRVNEVCNLKKEDVEFTDEGAYLTIFSNKNKDEFIKFIPSDVSFYLKKIMLDDSQYIFTNPRTKKQVTPKGAYWKIKKLSQKVLNKKIDNLTLRHSIATIIYNKDDIKDDDIAKQMGHTKSMKSVYVKNNREKLKEKAKRIYISPEELPPEKKHELELKIEQQDKTIRDLIIKVDNLLNSGYEKEIKKIYEQFAEVRRANK